jgi:hypothetical protein
MAEALVHQQMPVDTLMGFGCYDDATVTTVSTSIAQRKLTLAVAKRTDWYF